MKFTRRRFLKWAGFAAAGGAASAAGWSFVEPRWLEVTRPQIRVPNLPAEFDGLKIALVADIHHGPYFSIERVRQLVSHAGGLGADVVALCGDYVTREGRDQVRIEACVKALSKLRPPMGAYAVLGNHDAWADAAFSRRQLKRVGIPDLTNTGVWLRRGKSRLRLAGVGDLWTDRQNLPAALGDATDTDATVLLTHNPDYVERIRDSRVGLVLSGHTHGGQICLPFAGGVIMVSRYWRKYRAGLVRTRWTQVYVSRGIGVVGLPVRLFCRPELAVITLRATQ